uniref:Charged multivesicular body protein 6 n=1 Tax=Aceria tosichella TaxID=561515 RepID=A0A6G1SE14_9ACAR
MGNLFGVRRRAPQITAQDRAILQLKQQRDKIKIYQKRTESELARNAELALNLFKNGMKDRAIIVMRRKKMMEDILTRTDKQLETLESLVADIEYTQIEVSVVEGLRVGSEALKQLNSLMNIDDIQQMMEDNAEAAEKQREISAILSQSSERYAEDDLLKELEKYQTEATAAKLDKLPSVPSEVKPAPEQTVPAEETAEPILESPEPEATSGEVEPQSLETESKPEDTERPKKTPPKAEKKRVLVMEE